MNAIKKRCRDFYKKYSLRASSPQRSSGSAVEKEELATTSLKFEYLHRKSRCEMLIGGDYISNDIMLLTLVCQCLSTFALVSASR